jgi:hypothetical protein
MTNNSKNKSRVPIRERIVFNNIRFDETIKSQNENITTHFSKQLIIKNKNSENLQTIKEFKLIKSNSKIEIKNNKIKFRRTYWKKIFI